jgi:alanine racemase
MDQILIDCQGANIQPGDDVVLLGSQGDDHISAEEWASRLDTITWEVLCGLGERLPRRPVA